MCVCVRACVRACVCTRAHECIMHVYAMCVCVLACVRVCVSACVGMYVCLSVRMVCLIYKYACTPQFEQVC